MINFTGVLQRQDKYFNTKNVISWKKAGEGTIFEYGKLFGGYTSYCEMKDIPVETFTEKFLEADNNGTLVSLDTIA